MSIPDRRTFMKTVAGSVAAGVLSSAAGAAASDADGAAPSDAAGGLEPLGMLAARLALSGRRLTGAGTPTFTAPFVLADVALSPPRRFNEFSGDLSGRYVGALSVHPYGPTDVVADLVPAIIRHQRHDGRFGDDSLTFTADSIGPPHMALLWGNGRLLVGLLEYWQRHRDPSVLDSGRRLADFLVAVRRQCADPSVARRVEGQGAFGFICFTQLIEGLVLAASATGDGRYLETAAGIAPLLPPRGIQHSHGYLSTLRGVMLLHGATKDARWLEFVTSRYDDLVHSPDYTVYGAVLEYFGWETPEVTAAERAHLVSASGEHPRDEGCSSADFVRLSLQLWQATGRPEYLEYAERALENSLYPNQWETGDFGSRVTFDRGLAPAPTAARCWWCCTMHGHRALADVLASSIVKQGHRIVLTLMAEARWREGTAEITATRAFGSDGTVTWRVEGRGLDSSDRIVVRRPAWADRSRGLDIASSPGSADPAFTEIVPTAGGRASSTIELTPVVRLQSRTGEVVDWRNHGKDTVEGALQYGPWLLAADEAREPLFFGEPWPENVVHLPAAPAVGATAAAGTNAPSIAMHAEYEHGGFGGVQPVTLSPLSALTDGRQRTMAVWLRYRRA